MSSSPELRSIRLRCSYRVSLPPRRQIRRAGSLEDRELELSRRIADAASDAKYAAMLSSAVFITCAVTGSGDSVRKNANVPVTPEQIAAAALEAHSAGAAICSGDRKSTRLNSSHLVISYAVFCLKKKKK